MKRTLYIIMIALGVVGLTAGVATAKTKKVKTNVSFQIVSSETGDSFVGNVSAGKGCQANRQVTVSSPSGTFGTATSDATGAFTVSGNGAYATEEYYVVEVAQSTLSRTARAKKIKCLAGSDSTGSGDDGGIGIGGGGGGI